MQPDLVARAGESFTFATEHLSLTPGPRGARGQVWRLTAGPEVFALKHVFEGAPPARGEVGIEIVFARRAAAAGVCLPASHAARNGEYVVPLPHGGWLRLYDWLELGSADLAASAEALGILLARLHRCAPPADREPNGAPPDRWYAVPPPKHQWGPLIARATEADMSWAARLAAAVDRLPALHSILASTDPAGMLLCHRDLHPGNVLSDGDGDLVVVDWEDVGPADPAQELARALVACYADGPPDLASMRRAYRSYVKADGPARVRSEADFTLVIATQLNFLSRQVHVALDPTALARDLEWAELEIDESLRSLLPPDLPTTILDAL
ncbi:MAG: phosphotransferase [Ornithinimicrobium sp.]|uniref:phosphotransferase enzyme family protein n=1 Tax=Ornithinimicrobium sp. TaxID=1977084 RepID=UPI0026E0F3F2|nr:phosphotransferase [Ornithinimicrobium sp.]MDO5739861.1 phosphotransferase [Ornithinimicrobium sp.]